MNKKIRPGRARVCIISFANAVASKFLYIAIAKSFFRWFFDVGAQRAVPLHLGHGSPRPYGEITWGNPYKPYAFKNSRYLMKNILTFRIFQGKGKGYGRTSFPFWSYNFFLLKSGLGVPGAHLVGPHKKMV
ncbi:MAG: hypothetical protein FJ126_03360 [Deltaproteobacteria bacterium]|nr:hypothetical protein [Deltaproteobacteria bacterium]